MESFIAVQGCSHGCLDKIYQDIADFEAKNNRKVDLLLCCGDFQATRDERDLATMAVPEKFKSLRGFPDYYFERKRAPVTTIFIGGNHEASNYLWELPFGGWVAPNIYYMGHSNCLLYNGIRIAGVSGIYKQYDYFRSHYEAPPFNPNSQHSIYHTRFVDIKRLGFLKDVNVDIFLSHDWPNTIYYRGNISELSQKKRHMADELNKNILGDPNKYQLLIDLKPDYWFSAHMHTYYEAWHEHEDSGRITKFFALDKCLPKRRHLTFIKVPIPTGKENAGLEYDPIWLSILRRTSFYNSQEYRIVNPSELGEIDPVSDEDVTEVNQLLGGTCEVPHNFRRNTVFADESRSYSLQEVYPVVNYQTVEFCAKLGIDNPCITVVESEPGDNPDELIL